MASWRTHLRLGTPAAGLILPGRDCRNCNLRVAERRAAAARWDRERLRTETAEKDIAIPIPEHICENEVDRHEWRAEVLTFIRDHLDPSEIYRLGESDAEFGELLPRQPDWMEEDELDEGVRLRYGVGRYARRMVDSLESDEFTNPENPAG